MNELHLPWLEFAILIPLLAATYVWKIKSAEDKRFVSIVASAVTLAVTFAAWIDFESLITYEARDHWDAIKAIFGREEFMIDQLNAPLLPLTSLLFLMTFLATPRVKYGVYSFTDSLILLSITLAIFSTKDQWLLIGLLIVQTLPLSWEIHNRGQSTRVYWIHMAVFVVTLIAGGWIYQATTSAWWHGVAIIMWMIAVFIRGGCFPVHCWITDLFEKTTFGVSILFITPMIGAYAAMRLIVPVAPDWAMQSIAFISLGTALYASCMTIVQKDARRFFCFLFLSQSSLVFVGLETASSIGLAGALCVWISVSLALTGLGLTLRCIESRTGEISLTKYNGLYAAMPNFAGFFLLTGLSCVGFPCTLGFIGSELLVDSAIEFSPLVGFVVVASTALNGIGIMRAYFRIFTGVKYESSIPIASMRSERIAILTISVILVGGGLLPQLIVNSRYKAAVEILEHRTK